MSGVPKRAWYHRPTGEFRTTEPESAQDAHQWVEIHVRERGEDLRLVAALELSQGAVDHLMEKCDLGATFGLDVGLLNGAGLATREALDAVRRKVVT